jgi:hypothetical protein
VGVKSVDSQYLQFVSSWSRDPLCKYQPRNTGDLIASVPEECIKPGTWYVTLERKDDAARKILHNTLALTSLCLVATGVVLMKK